MASLVPSILRNHNHLCQKLMSKMNYSLYYLPKLRDSVRLWNDAFLDGEEYLKKLIPTSCESSFTVNGPFEIIGKALTKNADLYLHVLKNALCLGHPLSRELKNLLYSDKLCFQLRFVTGLLVGASVPNEDIHCISKDQRILATCAEMLYTSNQLHRATVNFDVTENDKCIKQRLVTVNGFSILMGDLLFSRSLTLMAQLKSPTIYKDMSVAYSRMSEGIFEGTVDVQSNPILPESGALEQWKMRTDFYEGNILSALCKSILSLSNQSKTNQMAAYNFAKYFVRAYQGSKELRSFTEAKDSAPFGVASLPIIHKVETESSLGEYLRSQTDINVLDFNLIRRRVMTGNAIQKTKQTIGEFVRDAENELRIFANENTNAFHILLRMTRSLKEN